MVRRLADRSIAVVGGGVIGLSIARHALANGARVTVYDRARCGSGASAAASGIVTLGLRGRSALRRLKRAGYESWERWLDEWRERGQSSIGVRRRSVRLFDEPPADLERRIESWTNAGHEVATLTPTEVVASVPGLDSASFSLGLAIDRELILDPVRVLEQLRQDIVDGGGVIEEDAAVTIEPRGPSEIVCLRDGIEVAETADLCVLAAGWGSAPALAPLAPSVALAPVGGCGLLLEEETSPWSVHFGEKGRFHWLPRNEGVVYLGSTVREEGETGEGGSSDRESLIDAAIPFFPRVAERPVVRLDDGLRPKALRRGGPFLGAYPGRPRLQLATGHYRVGLATAAATAEMLVDAWAGGAPIEEELSAARILPDAE